MNITQTTATIPDVTNITFNYDNGGISSALVHFWMEVASIAYATEELFLGNTVLSLTFLEDNRSAGQPSFLDINVRDTNNLGWEFSWGNVLTGIEEMSHNITAVLLTLSL